MNKRVKVAFLVDNYFPKFSPVAKCGYNIAEELSSNHEVFVITLDGEKIEMETEEHNNQKVIRCTTPLLLKRKMIDKRLNRNKKKIVNILLIRLKRYFNAIFSKNNIDNDVVKSFYNAIESVKPDVVIPLCLPFEAVMAAVNYKMINRNVVLVPFLFDRFTYNKSLQRNRMNLLIKEKEHIKLEYLMLEHSDHILAMHQLRDNFNIIFAETNDKISYVEHPLLKEPKIISQINNEAKVSFVYAGALYKKYRSPKYLLQVFNQIEKDYLLSFFSAGNCEEMINKFSQRDKRIRRNGYVSVGVLEQEYANADILLSIGNFKSQNLASKTFEYMSLGKPIIHFYENTKDPVLKLLDKYPLALTIEQKKENIQLNAKRIEEFCAMNRGKYINFDVVSDKYPDATPEYISKAFIEIIDNYKNKYKDR